jgi:hypothetical protein
MALAGVLLMAAPAYAAFERLNASWGFMLHG